MTTREVLLTEIEWLTTALENASDKGYSHEQRQGFGWAIGWLRLHAEMAR